MALLEKTEDRRVFTICNLHMHMQNLDFETTIYYCRFAYSIYSFYICIVKFNFANIWKTIKKAPSLSG